MDIVVVVVVVVVVIIIAVCCNSPPWPMLSSSHIMLFPALRPPMAYHSKTYTKIAYHQP
jgi:hypothetical protein